MSKPKAEGSGEDAQFLMNLRVQERERWDEYMQSGAQAALDAWRLARAQIQRTQRRREVCQ